MQRAAEVAPIALSRFGDAIHPPPAADDPLDVLGGAGPADSEQPLLGLRRSDAGQCADFGIRQLAAGERAGQQRERAERQRDANALAGGAGIQADAPRQPRGARTEAVGPAAARVEFSDEIEEVRRRGVQMRGQLRDLVAEAIQRVDGANGGLDNRSDADTRGSVHRRVLSHLCADSTPRFSRALRATRMRDRRVVPKFRDAGALGQTRHEYAPPEPTFAGDRVRARCPHEKRCQE